MSHPVESVGRDAPADPLSLALALASLLGGLAPAICRILGW